VNLANLGRGRFGEDEAVRWYLARGGSVLDRNWRCPQGELDLVVRCATVTCFVEVKARADDRFGGGAAAVGWRKQRRLRQLAAIWLAGHPEHHGEVRFDVVAVTGTHVEVLEGAF
jgi:putative endonuclease